jgi:parvulin-like peptidyl-prolyl isomerase
MIKLPFIFLISFLFYSGLLPQDIETPVATIDDHKITAKEFKLRYELSPFLSKDSDWESIKHDFLFSLIAEKLFSLEASRLGLEQSDKFKFAYKPIEKIYLRDALFEQEIKSKVDIQTNDIIKGMFRYNIKLKVQVFSSADFVEVFKISSMLEKGITIDSLNKLYESDTWDITLGSLKDEELEDTLYSLDVGKSTKPYKTDLGWFLFVLKEKISLKNPGDEGPSQKQVEEVLRDRRTEKEYKSYMKKTFSDKSFEADKELFLLLSEKIFDILKSNRKKSTDTTKFFLDEADFEKLKFVLGSEILNNTFFFIDEYPVTVKDFLSELFIEGFSVNALDMDIILNKMSRFVKSFMEKEYLSYLGYKKGLQNLPEVKKQLEMWKNSYLAQLYKNTFTDSARPNDDEVYQYFLEQQKSENIKAVNIVELLTDSLQIIVYVLNELQKGRNFKELAAEFTKREWTKNNGGEFGFFPVTMYGEIGRAADGMSIGEIYGPIKVDEGYSIFQLTDVKKAADNLFGSFSEVKERMKSSLFYERMNKILTSKTIELAKKYKITIYKAPLNSIRILEIPMFAVKLIGFGGRITAVPFTTPWYEWINEYELTKLLP